LIERMSSSTLVRMKCLRGDRISVAGVYRGTTETVDLFGRSTRIPVVLAEQYVSRPASLADSMDDEMVDILSTLLR